MIFSFLLPFFFSCFFPSSLLRFLILSYFLLSLHRYFPLALSFTSCFLSFQFPHSQEVPLSDLKCHTQQTLPFCTCLLQASICSLLEVRQVYGHGHVTCNALRQFVLVIDDTEAEHLYQSINCSKSITNTFFNILYVEFVQVFIYCRCHVVVGDRITNCMQSELFVRSVYCSACRRGFQNSLVHSN